MTLPKPKETSSTTEESVDELLIALLKENGRRSHRDIARTLDVTERVISNRFKQLTEADALRVITVVDLFSAGFELIVALGISVTDRPVAQVARELIRIPEVLSALEMSGQYQLEILVAATSHASLAHIVQDKLRNIRGVDELVPSICLNVFKYETGWGPFNIRQDEGLCVPESSSIAPIDRKIIAALWNDARATHQGIAAPFGLSEAAIRARLVSLRDDGVVRITAIGNISPNDSQVFAFIGIQLTGSHHEKVIRALVALEAVRFASIVLGRYDLLIQVLVPSNSALAQLINEHIATIPEVHFVECRPTLHFWKYDYRWTILTGNARRDTPLTTAP